MSKDVLASFTSYRSSDGDLRPTFVTCTKVYGSVCQVVDPMYLKVEQMVGMTLPLIVNKYVGLLVAIAFFPVLAISIPFLVVACTIGLPIFLPIVIVSAMLFIFNGLIILSLLAISPPGRSRLIEPFVEGLTKDEVGKKLLYTKYPMPTVTELATLAVPRQPWLQLLLCMFMDFICGNASYLLPILGEGTDFAWAPMQAAMMYAMFDKAEPSAKYVGFLEEILPGTDFIPSATLTCLKVNADHYQGALQMLKSAKKLA